MGILDELHIKVEEIQAEQLKRDSELEAQEIFYREHLRPVMLQAYQYLSDIVKKLNIVAPVIKPSYPLTPLKKQSFKLNQTDYRIDFDSRTSPHQIDITCVCALDRPRKFYVRTQGAALQHAELLQSYNFPHHRKDNLDKRFEISGSTFFLEGPMRVHIRITANAAERCVNVILRNIEEEPVKSFKFAPDKFNPDLLQRLARLLVREETTLAEVESVVSPDYRDKLRRQLEVERIRNEEELARTLAEVEHRGLEQENPNLLSRGKRILAEPMRMAMSFIKIFRN